jgi:hypothetical protein
MRLSFVQDGARTVTQAGTALPMFEGLPQHRTGDQSARSGVGIPHRRYSRHRRSIVRINVKSLQTRGGEGAFSGAPNSIAEACSQENAQMMPIVATAQKTTVRY